MKKYSDLVELNEGDNVNRMMKISDYMQYDNCIEGIEYDDKDDFTSDED